MNIIEDNVQNDRLVAKPKFRKLKLWHFLLDVLTNVYYEPYIHWSGNGLQFIIVNEELIFTEFRHRKEGGQPTQDTDPLERWENNLIDDRLVDIYLNGMKCFYKSNVIRKDHDRITKPCIQEQIFCGFYRFVDPSGLICYYLGWTNEELSDYIEGTFKRKQQIRT